MTNTYDIHGLKLSLPFVCDQLGPAHTRSVADAFVVEGMVSQDLPGARLREPGFDASLQAFLLRGGKRAARFLIERGTTITFERGEAYEEPLFLHLLFYQAMAALLRQRCLLVLHASAALSEFGAVIVAGESGAGKSTSVDALTALGWPLQTDDVCALRLGPQGGLEVLPGTSRIHLFADDASGAGLPTAGLKQHDWHRMKMAVPGRVCFLRQPEPVRRIVLLRKSSGGRLQIERLTGRGKLALLTVAYGPLLPEQIAVVNPILACGLQEVDVVVVTRPEGEWTLDAVIEAIRQGLEHPVTGERHCWTAPEHAL